MEQSQVVVIGAGMAGLAAARSLSASGVSVAVYEKLDRVGGRVRTEVVDGAHFDVGAQIIGNFYDSTLRLLADVHLRDELVPISGVHAILRSGRLYPLDAGMTAIFSHLLPLGTKAKFLPLLAELAAHWNELDIHAIHKAYQLDTGSLARYIQRTLGDEALEYLMQPPLAGIFYWTPEHTSAAILFLLLKAGIRLAGIRLKIWTLRNGLDRLPAALAATLPVHCNAEVLWVIRDETGAYRVRVREHGQVADITAAGVVCATPAVEVAALMPDLSPQQRAFFQAVRYSATAMSAIGLENRQPSSIHSFFCPRREVAHLAAVTTQSGQHPAPLPDARDVLGLFSSGAAAPELLTQSDERIHGVLRAELEATGFVHGASEPEFFHREYRWTHALPEFDVGSLVRLREFASGALETGAIVFAGDYLGGPFIEGAVVSGEQAADRLLQRLRTARADSGA